MLFKKHEPVPAPETETAPALPDAQDVPAENPFASAAEALIAMQQDGELPERFDLEAACADPAFAKLLQEFEPKAAVRIYAAESAAAHAYEQAMAAMTERLHARNALPKTTKPNRAVSPTPDYMSLSPAEFRALETELRTAARNGKRITL